MENEEQVQVFELTPKQDPKISGVIKQNGAGKYAIQIKSIIGYERYEKAFIWGLEADSPEELIVIIQDFVAKNDLELNLKEIAVRGTKIKEIISLHLQGKTIPEIIAAGYHKSTVNTQVKRYIKENTK